MSSEFSLPHRGVVPELSLSAEMPQDAEALVVPVFQGEDGLDLPESEFFDGATVRAALDMLGATGAAEEVTKVPASTGPIVAVGVGKRDDMDAEKLRRAAGVAARSLTGLKVVATTLGELGLAAAVEGIALGAYTYRGLKTADVPEDQQPVKKVVFLGKDQALFDAAVITAEAVAFARDLVNAPSSHLFPESYTAIATSAAEDNGLTVEVLDDAALAEQGFGGIVAVGQGSTRGPRLVRISYAPEQLDDAPTVALVGKGITFDTGGVSIKPAANMDQMISDMGGSAAVLATIIAAARLKLNVKVTATIPMAENMPGGNSYRPGDVITHYGGTTSEILNTDAEGRLILADAIARASEDNPDYLIETATLTGAQMVALGLRTAGVMGSDAFRDRVAETGRSVGEQAWAMPIPEEMSTSMSSPVADLRNADPSRWGGMLSAGYYLGNFVGEGIEWVHIDIAGPSFNTGGAHGYTPARATGAPVRTLIAVLEGIAGE
ncbi:leucyl aminopeptidase [Corynebacterium durum]|uniref:leucyl aminopeptidase n=1 Tax=Corynebacterium durum TaxID=61592 RepID=UPI0028E93287|nr:leucyl aminopeptidase [Corynebacterium durum]